MNTRTENFIFGILGAITAVVIGLAVFDDFQKPIERTPASQEEKQEYTPDPYLID